MLFLMNVEEESVSVRIERDSMGPLEVPGDRYWGAQTQRSLAELRASAASGLPAGD